MPGVIDENPPVTGKNNMAVGIKDRAGKNVTVAVYYGMPAMSYKAGSSLKDKRYLATLNFSISGPWSIAVKITRGGKTQMVKRNVDVK